MFIIPAGYVARFLNRVTAAAEASGKARAKTFLRDHNRFAR